MREYPRLLAHTPGGACPEQSSPNAELRGLPIIQFLLSDADLLLLACHIGVIWVRVQPALRAQTLLEA